MAEAPLRQESVGNTANASLLRFDAVEFVPHSDVFNVFHEDWKYHDYDYSITYKEEIDTMMDKFIQNSNACKLELLVDEESVLFAQWIECPNSCYYAAEKIINLSSLLVNFQHFGAKLCSKIIDFDQTSSFAMNVWAICSQFETDHCNSSIKGFTLFLAELYKFLDVHELSVHLEQVVLKALRTLLSQPYNPTESKITVVVTILKYCSPNLNRNYLQEMEEIFIHLLKLKASCNYKDRLMIQSLENCRKTWEEEANEQPEDNGIEETLYSLDETQLCEYSYEEMNYEIDKAYERFLTEELLMSYNILCDVREQNVLSSYGPRWSSMS